MSKNWTEKDLTNKGLTIVSRALKKHGEIIIHRGEGGKERESILIIPGIVDGLNGSKGLIRGHWSQREKIKSVFIAMITENLIRGKMRKHSGKVVIEYIGYKSVLMDWDNYCSSFKLIGDALVECGVMVDDKPSIVKKFIPSQIKCKRVEQKVVVIIKDLTE